MHIFAGPLLHCLMAFVKKQCQSTTLPGLGAYQLLAFYPDMAKPSCTPQVLTPEITKQILCNAHGCQVYHDSGTSIVVIFRAELGADTPSMISIPLIPADVSSNLFLFPSFPWLFFFSLLYFSAEAS